MEKTQTHKYLQTLSELAKKYNADKSPLQIKLSLIKTNSNYMIRGRKSACKIIYDPLNEADINDIGNAYICHTRSDLIQIIDYMIANYNDFATYKPGSSDVYDQPDIKLVSYDD